MVVIILGVILVGVGLFLVVLAFARPQSPQEKPIILKVDGVALQGLNVGLLLIILGIIAVLAPAFTRIWVAGQATSPTQATSPPTGRPSRACLESRAVPFVDRGDVDGSLTAARWWLSRRCRTPWRGAAGTPTAVTGHGE